MFIDASFASHHDGAGHSAMVTFVGTTATILRSSKQKIGTENSTEAELVALSDLYFVGLWLHRFLQSLGVPLEKPIILPGQQVNYCSSTVPPQQQAQKSPPKRKKACNV